MNQSITNRGEPYTLHGPVPVTIVAGFLGSGKSTLLNQMLQNKTGRKIGVIVNDFGSINIDQEMISEVAGNVVTLDNGCICCSLRTDLIGSVLGLAASNEKPDHIVIEASGVADPHTIAESFLGIEIWDKVILDGVITVVDAEQVLDVDSGEMKLTKSQVTCADIVLLNKIDLASNEQADNVYKWIREQVKGVHIFETVKCNLPIEVLLGAKGKDFSIEMFQNGIETHVHEITETQRVHSHDHDLVFDTWTYISEEEMDLNRLQHVFSQLPYSVLRVKGFIKTNDNPETKLGFQLVGRRATMADHGSWENGSGQTRLAFISRHGTVNFKEIDDALNNSKVALDTRE
jgi:G3E family GTPase